MKPLPSRPPLSTRRSRGGGEGGIGRSSRDFGGGGGSSVDTSARWATEGERSPNPAWMRKLEEKYQRLHHKIISIPSYNSTASRFNFLTRRLLNERLAKAHRNKAASSAGEDESRDTNTAPNVVTTGGRVSDKRAMRNANTAPNPTGCKDGLQTEEFVSLAANDNDSDTYSDDLNDENFPPPAGMRAERAGTELNGESGESARLSHCLCASHSLCRTDPARAPLSLPSCPLHSGGGGGVAGDGGGVGSVETLDPILPARRSPLLKRDGALEVNNNTGTDLAEAASLAHVSGRPTSFPRHGADHQPGISSARRLTSASLVRRHGHGASMVTGGRHGTAGADDVGGEREGGVAGSGWVSGGEMGETSASGVRTLNPITSGASKHGSMLRTAQTGVSHYSQATTKSCPAVLNSDDLPTAARRGGGRQEPGGRGGRHNMRVFAQMSVEARHAVTETLREMVAAGEAKGRNGEDGAEDEEGEEEEEDNGDGDDDYQNGTSNVSFPSLTDPHPTCPPQHQQQHQHQHQQQRRSKQHNDTNTTTQQSRENSMMTVSNRTNTTLQRSYRAPRQADTTSSVNTTVRGGRSPRRTNRKPRTTNVSVSKRGHHRSDKTAETTCIDVRSDEAEQREMDLDFISMASTGNASSNRSSPEVRHEAPHRMHLPAITSRTDPNVIPARRDNIRHVNYRIQGVGSYRVARETTFEITAPDFDIRYRDVITCQKGDRDTPPPDIFEKSVGKVRDWLNKYYSPSS